MLKYNYLIERNENDTIITLEPTVLPRELQDLVYIEAPNSIGKSTLLNILALAFFGFEKKELNNSLRKKLINLYDSDHQKIKFSVELKNKILGITIKSEKKELQSKEIIVRKIENGKDTPISRDNFEKYFKLIYDIPDNPLKRLDELLDVIKEIQNTILNRLSLVSEFIRKEIATLKDGRDPKKIKELKKKIADKSIEIQKNTNKNDIEKSKYNDIYMFILLKQFFDIDYKINKLKDTKKKIEQKNKLKNKLNRNFSAKQKQYLKKLKDTSKNAKNQHEAIIEYLKDILSIEEFQKYRRFTEIDIRDISTEKSLGDEIIKDCKELQSLISLKLIKNNNEEALVESKFLDSLKKLLYEYNFSSLKMPGTDKPISYFLDIIESRINENSSLKDKLTQVEYCERSLGFLIESINVLINDNQMLNDPKKDPSIVNNFFIDKIDLEDIEELKKNLEEFELKKNDLYRKLIKLDVDEVEFKSKYKFLSKKKEILRVNSSEDKINLYLESLKDDIRKKDEQIKTLQREKELSERNLENLKRRKASKYTNYYSEIELYHKSVMNLETKFKGIFEKLIIELKREHRLENLKISKDEQKYLDQISIYLSKKIPLIRHIETSYSTSRIDMKKREIKTTGNKIIKFDDLGTGQSQSAFLEGLLNISDGRKIIALFDEVAMLDSKSLEPIIKKLKYLYSQGNLLFGVIIQKGDSVLVKDLT